jgi:integrase
MGRPRLEIGTYGDISCWEEKPDTWRAEARFRDQDGMTRPVKAFGPTAAKAKAKLRAKLKDRKRGPGGVDESLSRESTVRELLDHVLAVWEQERVNATRIDGAAAAKGEGTLFQYRRCATKVIVPALAEVKLRELTTPRADRFLRELTMNATMARTVLKQACDFAIRYGAMDFNPVSAAYRSPKARREPRALTPDEAIAFRDRIIVWQRSQRSGPRRGADRVELFDVLLATGVRIGELLALEWGGVHGLDGDGPVTVFVGWHLDFKGRRVPLRKGGADPITLTVDQLGVDALRRQRARGLPWDLVFPSAVGTPQGESNVYRNWRAARGDDLEWVVPHTLRKTVVTAVERHLGLESAARQAGHAGTEVTRRHYVERNQIVPDHTEALSEFSRRIRAVGN